ncbi:MAG: spermidine/putrescine transport system permease protein [Actinomycetota bacterium]|jgi:spermidine/putrescine transport system permease protein|nr:spermidine/putrescine transport system permease protein [Actinomycetota bacterium]
MAVLEKGPRLGSDRPAPTRRPSGPITWLRRHLLILLALLIFLYMFLPVFVVVVFSFNRQVGKNNYTWHGFSLKPWTNLCDSGLCPSVRVSLQVGVIATVVATILGTLVAFGLSRYRFAGRSATNLLIFLPMATPEIVMGSSLAALFVNLKTNGGFWPIVIAHVMFCLSFVVVTVKARIAGLDPRLEQAAMDLYANERTTFWKVTFPLVLPGIIAGALLSFSLSFDDYIVTSFNSGQVQTFPLWVYGTNLRGLPAQANVIGSAMFFIALILVVVGRLVARRNKI